MITAELLDLLEITRKLVNRKAELDKVYFDQFVRPAWELFSQIHENYKITFREYIKFVESDDYDPKVLIDKIRQDSFQTQDMRNEMAEIVRNFPTARLKVKEIYLLNFSKAISNYFSTQNGFKFVKRNGKTKTEFNRNSVELFKIQLPEKQESEPYLLSDVSNAGRIFVVRQISRKVDAEKEEAKDVLESAIREFQSRQGDVTGAYHKLRSELLS